MCDYGFGPCTAPDTLCPHWQGIFCEFDTAYYKFERCIEAMHEIDEYVKEHPEALERLTEKFSGHFADVKDIEFGDKMEWRERRALWQIISLHLNPLNI